MNFFRSPKILTWIYPDLIWRMPGADKEIFLTFDDGPIPGVTEFVLETLKGYQARATFFCIGDNVRKYPHIFKKVVEEEHAIGNHTFNHLKGWNYSLNEYINNINRCSEILNLKKGAPLLFRPPYGRIKRSQINMLQERYKIIMWDVLTHDYAKTISPEKCLKGTLNATRPGSIVVFHDSLKAEKNMKYVLPKVLDYFSNKDYKFKAISV